ncbi:DUF4254 domain-containing protein [Burkholderia multivorans]|uniref:DUF4254 domain-containing protein n=1 Tax=Burkholderia multivorans TaxID=87883 RepID=UPI0009E0E1DF|nr:DUF4254 domain-containing protein [Burkholderia multivorans]SAJ63770.1 glycosyl transferase family protein [Burkholderia multivorans]SAK17830.1 glycosyl transferase family protein [Burkholderia multivorans]HEM7810444.1 DUF4254 domain-containing protein [Burkholderia multivorans]HEM7816779.1 DUF4254 domain-containing protein [Burkholderia multivorans]HEM7818215.1 DUF4254 domain-containing protein [Burkholderia multivorans]
MQPIHAADITYFHDAALLARVDDDCGATVDDVGPAWRQIHRNHDCNASLWRHEDEARRRDVADRAIVENKRAIDRLNQQRNDAVEALDEVLLAALPPAHADARLNSETAGSMIDRLSILALKIHHMGLQLARDDVDAAHRASCRAKLERLREQRTDLAACLDTLLADAAAGTARFKVYRQYKMYNDPALNPYLGGRVANDTAAANAGSVAATAASVAAPTEPTRDNAPEPAAPDDPPPTRPTDVPPDMPPTPPMDVPPDAPPTPPGPPPGVPRGSAADANAAASRHAAHGADDTHDTIDRPSPTQPASHAVDVLIPTCDRAHALALTLTTVALQTHRPLRVVVSDQSAVAAADDALLCAAVRFAGAQGVDVQIERHVPAMGLAEQRAFLLAHARAPRCLYVDDDVILEADLVARLVHALDTQRCGFVGSALHGLSHIDDVRAHHQQIEFWDDRVRPEVLAPGGPEWARHHLHSAANLYHAQCRLRVPRDASRVYRVAWVGGCVLFDTAKLRASGGFEFWRALPTRHCGEDVLAQLRVMARFGGCGLFPSGAYHAELPTTVRERDVDAPFVLAHLIDEAAHAIR